MEQRTAQKTATKKATIRFIFITILIDMIGIGLLIPILPDVIRRFSDDPTFINRYFGYFISVYACMQFLASPVLGSLSDRFGRRPILLVSLLGAGLDYILMAFAPSLSILFLGRVISGLTGANMTVASSYIADVSDDSNRAANFGMIGAAFGMGFIVGPLLGGLLGSLGPKLPFLAAALLNLVNFAYGYFVLPESLPAESRRQIQLKKLNPFKSLAKVLRPSPIVFFIWIYAFICLAGQVHPSTWTLYTEYKFGWSAAQVGLSLATVGLSFAISQAWLTRIIIPRLGEERSLHIGVIVYVFGFMMFAFAAQGWMMYAILPFFAFSGVANPSLQSLISRQTPSNEQGELQGSLFSINSVTAIIGPLFFTGLFARFTAKENTVLFPGASYFGASVICAVALTLLFVRGRSQKSIVQ